jgi:hypothetical protein
VWLFCFFIHWISLLIVDGWVIAVIKIGAAQLNEFSHAEDLLDFWHAEMNTRDFN